MNQFNIGDRVEWDSGNTLPDSGVVVAIASYYTIEGDGPIRGIRISKAEWAQQIIDAARRWDRPVFLKDNLHWGEQLREYPKGVSDE